MFILTFTLFALLALVGFLELGVITPPIAVAMFCGFFLFVGVLRAWEVISNLRRSQRRSRDAFVREVVRGHQRANEARQATERA